MTNRFLMCAPDHFEVSYVINPWMEGNVALSHSSTAHSQWKALAEMIEQVAHVEHITPTKGVPDMVFTANAGLVLGNKFILSHFLHAQRQAEEPHFAQWFAKQGFEVLTLPPDIPFEGAGDALLDRQLPLLWMGHGHRTSMECAPLIADMLGIEVEPLKLVNDRFYHLDTCFCPLEDGYLMYYPSAFDATSQARIVARIPAKRLIAVGDEDAFNFGCNAVNSGHTIFMNKASVSLVQQLKSRGFIVRQTELTEFMKAGGSAKCLTLKLNELRLASARIDIAA
jgi:N-dimethylarginine dimethylaminohydrolase